MRPKLSSGGLVKGNPFVIKKKKASLKKQGLPETEATERAKYAQARIAISNKYNNKKNRAKTEARFGEQAKETRKIKYVMKNGRYVRAESQD